LPLSRLAITQVVDFRIKERAKMDIMLYLLPVTLIMGLGSLVALFWAIKNQQFDDPKGDAERILRDDE